MGIILGVEISRLARSNKDWHQLLELCARFGTLIADLDGLYDPTRYNDRLLLGLKGTMSEAELHILRQRLLQGKLQKARRGELGTPPWTRGCSSRSWPTGTTSSRCSRSRRARPASITTRCVPGWAGITILRSACLRSGSSPSSNDGWEKNSCNDRPAGARRDRAPAQPRSSPCHRPRHHAAAPTQRTVPVGPLACARPSCAAPEAAIVIGDR